MLKKTVHLGIFFPLKKSRTIGNTIHGYQLCGQKQEVQADLYGHIFDEQVNRESFSNKETVLSLTGNLDKPSFSMRLRTQSANRKSREK